MQAIIVCARSLIVHYSIHLWTWMLRDHYSLLTFHLRILEPPPSDLIINTIGMFGRWQVWITFWLYIVRLPVAWTQLNILVIGQTTKFNCSNNADKCYKDCDKHIFDTSEIKTTIISDFDLVCEAHFWARMAQTFTMLGILVGNFSFGLWSDKQGRRIPLIVASVLQTACGTVTTFVPWFWLLCVLRFLTAVATGGTMVASFVILMEVIGTKWRSVLGTGIMVPFSIGYMSLALVGYMTTEWRYAQMATSLPSIVLFMYIIVVPESPRWLATVGKEDRAVNVLEKIARCNHLPTEGIRGEVQKYIDANKSSVKSAGNITDMFRHPVMATKSLCLGFNWIMIGMCFYGVSQYIGQLSGNAYVNITISAAMQIPGTLVSIVTMELVGRKFSLIVFDLIGGIPMLVIMFVSNEGWIRPILASICMFGLSAVFSIIYVYTAEMYPTAIRSVACGSLSMLCRVGSMIAPHIQHLSTNIDWLSPLIFGTMSIVGAVLCIFLPETGRRHLPETIEEAQKITWRSHGNDANA